MFDGTVFHHRYAYARVRQRTKLVEESIALMAPSDGFWFLSWFGGLNIYMLD